MEIGSVGGLGSLESSTDVGSTKKKDDDMGREQFLTMLVAQLKNQDPLNPMDGTDFTAQLAQFSSLEQMMSVNKNLEGMQMLQASTNNSQLTNLIGKEIEASGSSAAIQSGIATDISYRLDGKADTVNITIRDANGAVVRRMTEIGQNTGDHSMPWDGLNDGGMTLKDAVYTYTVSAVGATGNPVEATTFIKGQVSAVSFNGDGSSTIWMGGLQLPLGNIIKVAESVN